MVLNTLENVKFEKALMYELDLYDLDDFTLTSISWAGFFYSSVLPKEKNFGFQRKIGMNSLEFMCTRWRISYSLCLGLFRHCLKTFCFWCIFIWLINCNSNICVQNKSSHNVLSVFLSHLSVIFLMVNKILDGEQT